MKLLENCKVVIIGSGVLMIMGDGLKIIIPIVTKSNTLENQVYMLLIKQPIFFSGYLVSKYKIFRKIKTYIDESKLKVMFMVIMTFGVWS